jgi:glutaredoxin-related protein
MTNTTEEASRRILPLDRYTEGARAKLASNFPEIVREVAEAVAHEPVVVVGMAQNPHVRNVKNALTDAGIPFKYLEYGSYLGAWKARLAIKMWSGWPTFPQVFVKGVLLGGEDLTKDAIASGSLRKLLDAGS